jgi:hypothetical protein
MRLLLALFPIAAAAADEVTITTTTATGAEVRTEITTGIGPVTVQEKTYVRAGGWDLDLIGLRFGGITGGTLIAGLTYDNGGQLVPELAAGLGVSGTKVSLGCAWILQERESTISAAGLSFMSSDSVAIVPRITAHHRWEDEDRNAFWRGIVDQDGWYVGGEVGLRFGHTAVDVGCTVRTEDDDRDPVFTLAYGLDF